MFTTKCLFIISFISFSTVVGSSSGFVEKDCIVSPWSSWSICSQNCSVGERIRNKKIVQEPKGIFAKACGKIKEKQKCGEEKNGCQMLCKVETGKCHCENGFLLASDKKKCYNVDECHHNDGRGPCSQRCHDTQGSYKCFCNSGFVLDTDGHACIYNESITCSEKIHIRQSLNTNKCICKNRLDGVRCDRNLSACKKAACFSDTLCQTFVHAKNKCIGDHYQIPILLKVTPFEYKSGVKRYEVEDYVREILDGVAKRKSLHKLKSDFYKVRKNSKYFVESLIDESVKSSYMFVKYSVMDSNFNNMKINEICPFINSDIHCVTKEDCDILLEDGVICPPITTYNKQISNFQTSKRNQGKIKSWVYILISGFVIIIILLIILLFLYLKRGKFTHTNAYYDNSNMSQPIILNAEYNVLPQRDGTLSSWNNDPYPDDHLTFEAGNTLYNKDSDKGSICKSDSQSHIYESIDNLKSCVEKEFGIPCRDDAMTENENDYIAMRYQVPRKLANQPVLPLEVRSDDCCDSSRETVAFNQKVDLPEGKKEGSKGLVVDLNNSSVEGDDEPRYSAPPPRRNTEGRD